MTLSLAERHRLALIGWAATVATSLSLFTALQEKKFLVVGAFLSALVVLVGIGLRQLHVPSLLTTLVQLVVALELLLLGYGGHTAFGVVPTPATFTHVGNLVSSGMDVAQRYAAPVPPNAGLMMISVAFIVLIAIVVDLLAAGIARAPLAGLPLLALYAVPVASLPKGVPAPLFIPGAIGFLALLMVSERDRLAHWGRHVARSSIRDQSETVDTSGLASTGRRISALAITTAVVLPILVPTFTSSLFTGSGGIGDGNGQKLSFTDPMVSLARSLHLSQPVDLISVASDVSPSYLRLAVLDDPGANAWSNSGVALSTTISTADTFPPPPGQLGTVATTTRQMSLLLSPDFPRESVWLPVPNDVRSLQFSGFPGDFGYVPGDQTVTSRNKDSLGHVSSYTATYAEPDPTEAQLENATPAPADIVTRFSRVPTGVPAVVGDDARRVTAGLTTDYEKALALQSFFRDDKTFTYDLNAGYGDGYRAMSLFLQKRRGYCQHFAATMAMMARELGIPSRVVVGFLDPSKHDGQDDYVFTSHDAHAWPELYFGGVGWVRFEPTPGNGAVPPPYTHAVHVPTIKVTTPTQTTQTGPRGGGRITTDAPKTTALAPAGAGSTSSGTGGSVPPITWLVVLVAMAVILTPGMIRLGVRRSRLGRAIDGGPSSEYAWLELKDRILDLRLPWTGSVTPRARITYVEPLLGGDPDAVAALDRLSLTVERSRYASSPLAGAQPGDDARTIMAVLSRESSRKQRARAFLWPSSLMPEVRVSLRALRHRLRPPAPNPS